MTKEPSEAAMEAHRAAQEWLDDKSEDGHAITKLEACIVRALDRHAAAERERCAMIAHGYPMIAAAIRSAP